MKAAVVSAAGEAPAYVDFAEPVAGEGEEIVTVTAAAISPVTRSRVAGSHYSSTGTYPVIPGVDGVGRRADGQRIFFFMPRPPYGTLSERTVIRTGTGIPLPDDLDDVTAAAIGNPGVSSWAALAERTQFAPGQTVLVNGATGTSGRLAVQIARHLGAGRVIATGRNRDMLERLRGLGADAVIPLGDDDAALEASLKAEFAQGVDVVLDYLWGAPARVALVAAARHEAGAAGLESRGPAAALRVDRLGRRARDRAAERRAARVDHRAGGQRPRQPAARAAAGVDRGAAGGGGRRPTRPRHQARSARRHRRRLDRRRRRRADRRAARRGRRLSLAGPDAARAGRPCRKLCKESLTPGLIAYREAPP